ncbi:MAG: flagellar protein FliT [Clostridium sp.]|nr:flagellar protein FliT [Clostridium sp.]
MVEILKCQLKDFKEVTLKLIEKVENDEFEKLDELLEKRQEIIVRIDKLQYSQEEFRNIAESIDILPLQKKLLDLMNIKKIKLRNEMDKILEIKNANRSYQSRNSLDSVYFSKKI